MHLWYSPPGIAIGYSNRFLPELDSLDPCSSFAECLVGGTSYWESSLLSPDLLGIALASELGGVSCRELLEADCGDLSDLEVGESFDFCLGAGTLYLSSAYDTGRKTAERK